MLLLSENTDKLLNLVLPYLPKQLCLLPIGIMHFSLESTSSMDFPLQLSIFKVPYTTLFHNQPYYIFLRNFGCARFLLPRPCNSYNVSVFFCQGHTTVISCNSGHRSYFSLIISPPIKPMSAFLQMAAFGSLAVMKSKHMLHCSRTKPGHWFLYLLTELLFAAYGYSTPKKDYKVQLISIRLA